MSDPEETFPTSKVSYGEYRPLKTVKVFALLMLALNGGPLHEICAALLFYLALNMFISHPSFNRLLVRSMTYLIPYSGLGITLNDTFFLWENQFHDTISSNVSYKK